ncbi:hypothetical protein JTB14_037023 [Gonioctena quinquepunctata]|nr:hypothetical protein JTB14_037023 [Gonioctena quinquepunctata]
MKTSTLLLCSLSLILVSMISQTQGRASPGLFSVLTHPISTFEGLAGEAVGRAMNPFIKSVNPFQGIIDRCNSILDDIRKIFDRVYRSLTEPKLTSSTPKTE